MEEMEQEEEQRRQDGDAPCGRVGEHDEIDRAGLGLSHPYGPCQTKEEEELVVMIAERRRSCCNDKKKSEIYRLSPYAHFI